jgi:dTDP-4-dehydrorhamnose 3,5-epimerase
MMDIIETPLKDLYILKPKVFIDNRGYFFESYSQIKMPNTFQSVNFIQDNQSLSMQKGTLRGIHFQNHPKAQTKLIRCIQGSMWDVAIDLRLGSPTYLKSFGVELTSENYLQLLVPKGFGHGFITLVDNTVVAYKVDQYYCKDHDRVISYNDYTLKIDWKGLTPILSEKDLKAPSLKNSDVNFKYPL